MQRPFAIVVECHQQFRLVAERTLESIQVAVHGRNVSCGVVVRLGRGRAARTRAAGLVGNDGMTNAAGGDGGNFRLLFFGDLHLRFFGGFHTRFFSDLHVRFGDLHIRVPDDLQILFFQIDLRIAASAAHLVPLAFLAPVSDDRMTIVVVLLRRVA